MALAGALAAPLVASSTRGTAELELSLARKPDLYILIDPVARTLEVKARGLSLDTIGLADIALLSEQPLFGRSKNSSIRLPVVWTIAHGVPGHGRQMIAPSKLRAYSETRGEAATPESLAAASAEAKKHERESGELPTRFHAEFENGWYLQVQQSIAASSFWHRLQATVSDGWHRLFRPPQGRPPALALAISADDARSIQHLIRPGMKILIGPDPANEDAGGH